MRAEFLHAGTAQSRPFRGLELRFEREYAVYMEMTTRLPTFFNNGDIII